MMMIKSKGNTEEQLNWTEDEKEADDKSGSDLLNLFMF